MTERTRSLVTVAAGALAAFAAIAALLVVQMRQGRDPALGAGTAATVVGRHVLVRRIEERRVIVALRPAQGEGDDGAPPAGRVVVLGQAPSSVAPTPVPAAPLVTRTS